MEDNYNEGHSGFTISQIANVMRPALEMRPNVVLVHAGTNDLNNQETDGQLWGDAPARLEKLIDEVLDMCPDAVVLVARIIQVRNKDTNERIATLNKFVPAIVQERVSRGYKAVVVDQSVVGADELTDGLHP